MQMYKDKTRFYVHELKNLAQSLLDGAECIADEDEFEEEDESSVVELYRERILKLQNTFEDFVKYIDREHE